jgi:hypothetical protein
MTQQQSYNAHDHLIQIKGRDGQQKDYLPASWRLYELRLRYPHITIESEIVHMDVEHNFVIVKAVIYDSKTYEESSLRASSMKQGLLSALDKVETAAKARAARDFGVSTELALDSEPEEDLEPPAPAQNAPANKPTQKGNLSVVPQIGTPPVTPLIVELHGMYTYARDLGLITDLASWEALKVEILGNAIHDEDMQSSHVEKMRKGLAERKKKVANKK